MLHRSAGAIQRRCTDLGLKERPVKADNHGPEATWTPEDLELLADGIRHGESYTLIGQAIGKSEKAIRGKVYFTYLQNARIRCAPILGMARGEPAPRSQP